MRNYCHLNYVMKLLNGYINVNYSFDCCLTSYFQTKRPNQTNCQNLSFEKGRVRVSGEQFYTMRLNIRSERNVNIDQGLPLTFNGDKNEPISLIIDFVNC